MSEKHFLKGDRLSNISYAIRGPIFDKARAIEAAGHPILNLNIGNPTPFGFDIPERIMQSMKDHLHQSQGYVHHLGITPAREAIRKQMSSKGVEGVRMEDIFIGNGVSELILMSMQAILNTGDEVLVPAPDYPLWTASIGLQGAKAVHYRCDEASDWQPDLSDIASKITSKTKGIVLINPNNPTGAVYEKSILEQIIQLARKHDLLLFSDEIYDQILYDDAIHYPLASLCGDVPVFTYSGISKNNRAAGWRAGWLVCSGPIHKIKSILEGLNLLASLRLCANVPAQFTIQTALMEDNSIQQLVADGGRLAEQRQLIHGKLNEIPGVSCVLPKGALYLFPSIDLTKFRLDSDEQFAYQLLEEKHLLIVPGSGFNHLDAHHFRIVFLPFTEVLEEAATRMADFFKSKRK